MQRFCSPCFRCLFVITSLLLSLCGSSASAQSPDPMEIVIDDVRYGGTGCPRDSVGHYLSSDGKAFTLTFDRYDVDLDTAPGRRLALKSCTVDVRIRVPRGWMFSLFYLDFRGYADLDDGVQGTHNSEYRILGQRPQELGRLVIEGPKTQNYIKSSQIPLKHADWSRCGSGQSQNIVISTQIKVQVNPHLRPERPAPRKGLMTMDTMDGEVEHQYGIAWKKCDVRERR